MTESSLQNLERLIQENSENLEDAVFDKIKDDLEFYLRVKGLLKEGLSYGEVGLRLGMSSAWVYHSVHRYPGLLNEKIDLRGKVKDTSKREEIYNKTKQLIEQKLTAREIAKIRGVSYQAVYDYLNNHPELKRNYGDNRKTRRIKCSLIISN